MEQLTALARQQRDYMVKLRRHFHANPELSWKERETAGRIRRELDEMGLPWQAAGETGTIAVLSPDRPGGPVIGLRADLDALPIQEKSDAPYASRVPGVMHACGHDAHTAILLGTARALSEWKGRLRATVKLIFQPAEEVIAGARELAAHPLLTDLDNIATLHVWSLLPVGSINIEAGPRMASADTFEITVEGKGAHGSTPHLGIDALYVAGMVETGLQALVSRQLDPLQPAVISVGSLRAGTAPNIVASTAEIRGTIRAFREELRAEIPRRIEHMARHIALAFGATASFRLIPGTPAVVNDSLSACVGRKSVETAWGPAAWTAMEPTTGGEDFAYYLANTPGALAFVGCANAAKGIDAPHHNCAFDVDEDALEIGAAYFLHYIFHMEQALLG